MKGKLFEILKKESPFFYKDICDRYGYQYAQVWTYVEVHHELFRKEKIREGKMGRPAWKIWLKSKGVKNGV